MKSKFPDELQEQHETYNITHLFDNVIPRLKTFGVSDETLKTMFLYNPCKVFGG